MPGNRNVQESASGVDLPVAIAEGGTGATSAANARTNLGVAATSHTHAIADTTGLQAAIDGKAASSHSHAIADTTGLQGALDGKAATSHSHAEADVTGLTAALAGKSATGHTHVAANVTDLGTAATRNTGTTNGTVPLIGSGDLLPAAIIPATATNFCALHKTSDGSTTYYSTLAAAKAAASSGDCIEVSPGTYNEVNLLKNGVNWFFHAGAIVSASSGGTAAVFDDGTNGANGAVTCSIGGFGQFTVSINARKLFNIQNASLISVQCDKIETTGTAGALLDQSGTGSVVRINANTVAPLASATNAISLTGLGGYQAVETVYLDANGGGAVTINLGVGSSYQTVSATQAGIINNIAAAGTSSTQIVELGSVVSLSNCTISNSTARQSVQYSSTATAAFGLAALQQTGSGSQFVQVDMLDITGSGIACSGTGSQYIEADAIIGTNASNPVIDISAAGTQIIRSQLIRTNQAARYAASGSTGTQRLVNCRLENTGSNGIPLNLGGQTCILEGITTLIAHSGASTCANAGSAQNLKIYGNVVGNKALDSDITIQVGEFIPDSNVV